MQAFPETFSLHMSNEHEQIHHSKRIYVSVFASWMGDEYGSRRRYSDERFPFIYGMKAGGTSDSTPIRHIFPLMSNDLPNAVSVSDNWCTVARTVAAVDALCLLVSLVARPWAPTGADEGMSRRAAGGGGGALF